MATPLFAGKRSEVMSRIRGSGNKGTEIALAKLFRNYGITGWRRNQALFGKSDFTFRRQRIIVFVDGCFWHGCAKHCNMPVNNRDFWERKLTANKERDRRVKRTLRKQGWRVIRVWEHDLIVEGALTLKLERIFETLKATQWIGGGGKSP